MALTRPCEECMHNALDSQGGTQGQVGFFNRFNPVVCSSKLCAVVVVVVVVKSVPVSQGGADHPAPLSCGLMGYLTPCTCCLRVHLLSSLNFPRLFPRQSPQQVWPLWSAATASHPPLVLSISNRPKSTDNCSEVDSPCTHFPLPLQQNKRKCTGKMKLDGFCEKLLLSSTNMFCFSLFYIMSFWKS